MNKTATQPRLPTSPEFRCWLREALKVTGLKPSVVAAKIDVSVNSVGRFLREKDSGITLDRAELIERYIRKRANEEGVALPEYDAGTPLPEVENA